jgi:hypothetical protein
MVDLRPKKIGEHIPEAHYDFDPSFDQFLPKNDKTNYDLSGDNLNMP